MSPLVAGLVVVKAILGLVPITIVIIHDVRLAARKKI